ncbi:MAG: coenzyme F430 synthase [Halobacteriota archaeon]
MKRLKSLMEFSGKNVAVLDTIHGAREICKKLREVGAAAVAFNIYHNTPAPDVIDSFDVVITPIHANTPLVARAEALNIPVLTHHQAVGQLVRQSEELNDALVFEVTGVKGKTSSAALLGNAYEDRKLLMLTSLGLEVSEKGKYVAKRRLSITPASILTAMDLTKKFDFDPEVCIFEVSLGGTGLADVNIITTLLPEYLIAQQTKTSTSAKLQMITNAKEGSCLVAPLDVAPHMKQKCCLNTFGDDMANVRYDDKRSNVATMTYSDLGRLDGSLASGEIHFTLSGDFDFKSYESALLCFTAAALSANLSPDTISSQLSHFKGVFGRMSAETFNGRFLIDNSNSGLDEAAIKQAIQYGLTFKKVGHKVVLIIGLESNVCEGIAIEALLSLAQSGSLDHVVFVSDQERTLGDGVIQAHNLESALRKALELTDNNDVIISCVKMWR